MTDAFAIRDQGQLCAGVDSRPIAPHLSRLVYIAGYGPNRPATGTHDDLWVRTLALTVGKTRLALAACATWWAYSGRRCRPLR